MQKQNQAEGNSKAERGGDTSRSSSQGRKTSSGGNKSKRGNPQMDEASHSPKKEKQREKNEGKTLGEHL